MSERELAAMQRTARQTQPAPAMGGEASDAPPPEPARGNKPAGETERKMVKFRDRFPFLNTPQCPDVLKILVADMFTAYNLYKEAHSRPAALPGDPHLDAELEDTAALCRQVVERYLENRTIWEELEHYQEHRALLGKHPRVKAEKQREWIRQLPDLELKQLRDNASANLSKWKDKLKNSRTEQEEEHAIRKLEQHTARKQAAEMELERRKPK